MAQSVEWGKRGARINDIALGILKESGDRFLFSCTKKDKTFQFVHHAGALCVILFYEIFLLLSEFANWNNRVPEDNFMGLA